MPKILINKMLDRELTVLISIVEAYITTTEPVGSRYVSKLDGIKYSPATLRNIMSDLTEMGLIRQPHVSAGRTPTDMGLRVYVEYKLSQKGVKALEIKPLQEFLPPDSFELNDLFKVVVNYTSVISGLVSLLTTPRPSNSYFRRLEFISISDNRILIVVITKSGMVIHKTVFTREKLDNEMLNDIASYMNENYIDKQLKDVRELLVENIGSRHFDNEYVSKWVRLCKKAFNVEDYGRLLSSGFSSISQSFKVNEKDNLSLLNYITESQEELIPVLNYEPNQKPKIRILIGEENKIENLREFSIVQHPYGLEENILGIVGIIGPKYMDYYLMSKIVERVAKQLTSELTEFNEKA